MRLNNLAFRHIGDPYYVSEKPHVYISAWNKAGVTVRSDPEDYFTLNNLGILGESRIPASVNWI